MCMYYIIVIFENGSEKILDILQLNDTILIEYR